jgi:formate dehydrogenase maturation protein FdhE
MADVFEKRIRRAEQLSKNWAFATEILRFYALVVEFQRSVHTQLAPAFVEDPEGYFVEPLKTFIPGVCTLIEAHGPPEISRSVAAIRTSAERNIGTQLWLARCDRNILLASKNDFVAEDYAARILLEPFLMRIRVRHAEDKAVAGKEAQCPVCESGPAVSLLREDKAADTVRRTLICPFCSQEWDFARVLCPSCKEERPEKLPRYTAQEIPWMRVEACDSCGQYLKSVDLTQNWEAEPIVDELASTPLDVIAREHGYTKIAPNLAGI